MSKALIIAEKPSVANDIARALGGFKKHDDYFESDDYVLSSAIGHLVEIAAPEEYDVKRGKWSFANLPVIPPHFDLNPIAKTESRLKLLTRLIKRKDVDRLINACDAGREGELIFRLIAQHAKAKQPVERLWLQSMTQNSIRDGFDHLRSDAQMNPLADAAKSRSEADWLIGINGTRAMTAFNSKGGGFFLTTVGRVQTPTLSIVVEREEKIKRFVSRDYWEVHAEFVVAAGVYPGRWFDPKFKRTGEDPDQRDSRLWGKPAAESIVAACRGKQGTVTEESKPSTSMAPGLFDLTSLQRDANGRFGFSAKNTLGLAQALYERHKVLTYPRTDSRHLPDDYLQTVKETVAMLKDSNNYNQSARLIEKGQWVKLNKRIFDNSKISDHFAIIPTLQPPGNLSEPEQKLYDLVVRRFLAVFFPPAEFLVTTRITEVAGHQFKTEGKVLIAPGWLQVYGKEAQDDDANLVAVAEGEKPRVEKVDAVGLVTKPPARYTEATLLSAMEGAGKLVDDEDLREAMSGKGLGDAGHPRGDHRRPAVREVHGPRRPRTHPDREGVPADDAVARPRRQRVDRARTHGRVGAQARVDGERLDESRGLHARDRADDADHRASREGVRQRYDPRRLRDIGHAVSQLPRQGARELSAPSRALARRPRATPVAASRSARFPADASSRSRKSRSSCRSARSVPCRASAARWAVHSRRS